MSEKQFQVYCDMKTHGGGWTLVYSYTFTNYDSDFSESAAVTPRPNWPASDADTPISTTPPLNESSLGAVDWNLWKTIGQEFMIKSNINDRIVCEPGDGSIVEKINGYIRCHNLETACTWLPNEIDWRWGTGPSLTDGVVHFYNFDGSTDIAIPSHVGCSQVDGNVTNPVGQIYLRGNPDVQLE